MFDRLGAQAYRRSWRYPARSASLRSVGLESVLRSKEWRLVPFDNRPWAGTRDRRTFRSSEHHQRRNTGYQAQMKKIRMKKIRMKKIRMKKIQSRWSFQSTKGQ